MSLHGLRISNIPQKLLSISYIFIMKSAALELTKREREVLSLILDEKTSKEIGDSLQISPRTVEIYRKNLLNKVGARNTVGLVKYALTNTYWQN